MPAPAVAAAAIGAGAQLLGGLFGKKKEVSGYKLPPALEARMLQQANQGVQFMEQQLGSLNDLLNTYNERIGILEQGVNATIPNEQVLEQLTSNSANIALQLGASAEELIQGGFLGEDDIKSIEDLSAMEDKDFKDEAFEKDYTEQRAALEQQLLRDGRSLAEISQTLAAFDSQKNVERQQVGDIRKQGAFNRGLSLIQARANLRQTNFGNIMQTGAYQQNVIGGAQQGFANLGSLASGRLEGASMVQNQGSNLATTAQSLYQSLGGFRLSNSGAFGADPEKLSGFTKRDSAGNVISAIGQPRNQTGSTQRIKLGQ